ncbi:hypothetical protein MRX96_014699 [Rhipicephalus microplus]
MATAAARPSSTTQLTPSRLDFLPKAADNRKLVTGQAGSPSSSKGPGPQGDATETPDRAEDLDPGNAVLPAGLRRTICEDGGQEYVFDGDVDGGAGLYRARSSSCKDPSPQAAVDRGGDTNKLLRRPVQFVAGFFAVRLWLFIHVKRFDGIRVKLRKILLKEGRKAATVLTYVLFRIFVVRCQHGCVLAGVVLVYDHYYTGVAHRSVYRGFNRFLGVLCGCAARRCRGAPNQIVERNPFFSSFFEQCCRRHDR